jgi:hypothetical protein
VPAAAIVKDAVVPSQAEIEIGCGEIVIVPSTVTIKFELLVAIPTGVVTAIAPDVAATAVTLVAETTVNKVAVVPPKLTAVAPVKLVPVIVTVVPAMPLVGVNDVIVGEGINVKPALVAVPPAVVTDTFPDAPASTTAMMLVADTTINEAAAVPPKLTAVVPVKFVPVIVTVVPAEPPVGVKFVIVGGIAIVKLLALVTVLHPIVTLTVPVVAPAGTVVVMLVAVLAVGVAVTPLNLIMLLVGVRSKFVPVMVTVAPILPDVGAMDVTVGGGITVKIGVLHVPIVVPLSAAPVAMAVLFTIMPAPAPISSIL